jgi:outer membrane protein TolC
MLIKTGGIFILAMLWMARPLLAQDTTIQLSLKDAIDLSIKNSKQLKTSRARIDEAVAAVQEAKDKRLPDVKISGSYLRVNNPNIDLKNKSNSNGSGSTSGSEVNVSQAMYGIANVSYPIYSGQRTQYGIESAKYLEQAERLDADNDRDAVVLNAVNAYVNLYKAKAAVDLVKDNLSQSRKRDTDFANLEKNGIIARNDLLKAQLQTSNIELSLLDAENNRDLANVNMNLLLGLPERATLVLDSNSLATPGEPTPITAYEQQALQNRKDIQPVPLSSLPKENIILPWR